MKIQYVIDRLGPNPAYDPPRRKDFLGPEGAEEYANAKAAYDVPPQIVVPAGSVHAHELAWIHCFPDQSGIAFKRNDQGKVVPYRKAPGMVVAIPADEHCEKQVARTVAEHAASRGVPPQTVQDEIAAGVAKSRALAGRRGRGLSRVRKTNIGTSRPRKRRLNDIRRQATRVPTFVLFSQSENA